MTKLSPHAELGLNELDNADALGDLEAGQRARKVLAAADLDEKGVAALRRSRAAAVKAEEKAEAKETAKADEPPAGRSSKSNQQHTAQA